MVYRVFVEKKKGLDNEARALLNDAKTLLGINSLENIRIFNRYDAQNLTEELFDYSVKTVFSEPQLDIMFDSLLARKSIFRQTKQIPIFTLKKQAKNRATKSCKKRINKIYLKLSILRNFLILRI